MNKIVNLNLWDFFVVIITICIAVGILSPYLLRLSTNAQTAATTAVASALSAANANNYAVRMLNSSLGKAINNCTDARELLQGSLPTGYTITGAEIAAGSSQICTLRGPGATVSTFIATGVV